MRRPHIDDCVRLTQDIPEFALCRGEKGVVRSTWFAHTAYEVEFRQIGADCQTRVLVVEDQFEIDEQALLQSA